MVYSRADSSTNVTDGGDSCAEIDLASSSRLNQGWPSNYEPVPVRNIGLMLTKGLNSFESYQLAERSTGCHGKEAGQL